MRTVTYLALATALTVSLSASAVSIPFASPYNGAVLMHISNLAMGTVYDVNGFLAIDPTVTTGVWYQVGGGQGYKPFNPPFPGGGFDAINHPSVPTLLAPPGGKQGEDGWGIFVVDQILSATILDPGKAIGSPTTTVLYDKQTLNGGVELVGAYYNRQDIFVMFNGDGSQTFLMAGDDLHMFAQPTGTFNSVTDAYLDGLIGAGTYVGGDAGSVGRVAGQDKYIGIGYDAFGNLLPGVTEVLTMVSADGFLPTAINQPAAAFDVVEGTATFTFDAANGTGNGRANLYYDVVGGGDAPGWDTNWFTPNRPGNFTNADISLEVTDKSITTRIPSTFDWLTSSSDPVTAYALPEPLTMLAVGLGLAGLGRYVRRRTA